MNKFVQRLVAIVAALGLKGKFDAKELTKEDQAALIEAYNKAHGEKAFATDFEAYQAEQAAQASQQEAISSTLAQLAGIAGVPEGSEHTPEGLAQILASVNALKTGLDEANANIAKLTKQAAPAAPVETVVSVPSVTGAHTPGYAFGIQNPLFATGKRYNAILVNGRIEGTASRKDREQLEADFGLYSESLSARYNELRKSGQLAQLKKQAKVDYSALTSDTEIGTRQLTIRQDMVIARIVALPTLAGIFDTVSNVQSGQVLTNVLFSEVSQAYQAGEVFKGDVKIQPEKAYVHKAMAKLRFEDMSALEHAYLNYLNREGSDPVKWTLLEWIILQIATIINNERNQRSIVGCYVPPVAGEPGHTNFASTGILHRLIGLVEDNKVMPFIDEELADFDSTNIGDVLIYFVKKMSTRRSDYKSFTIYLSAAHRAMFKEWYRNKYGKDTDFAGVSDLVPNYEVAIKWVPFMGNLKFIFATVAGNAFLLQNVPGEEYNNIFERHLEEVITASYWKEGAAFGFAGEQFKNREELLKNNGRNQFVFTNWPVITAAADATTVDVEAEDLEDLGWLIKTSANTKATVLTDILNAKEGVVYRIECGSMDNATTISKAGKFDQVDAWTPTAVGSYIKLYWDAKKGKFFEVSRG